MLPFKFIGQSITGMDGVCGYLQQSGLPRLWIPKRSNFYQVEAIPILGSGKLDLKQLKAMALEKSSLST